MKYETLSNISSMTDYDYRNIVRREKKNTTNLKIYRNLSIINVCIKIITLSGYRINKLFLKTEKNPCFLNLINFFFFVLLIETK